MIRPRRCYQLPMLIALALAGAAAPTQAADPFYIDLLNRGKDAAARGDLANAVENLEIACFGLLDEPEGLADCLSHLALAQADSGLGDLQETLSRLLEVERRFRGYSAAQLEETKRTRVDDLFLASYPVEELRRIETFRPAAERQDLERMMAVGPAQRRELLTARLERNPNDVQAHQMLAELETVQGNPGAALPHLETLIDLAGGNPTLVCRRFRAAAMAGQCETALQDTVACADDTLDPTIAAPVLECLLDGGDLAGATAFVDTLPLDVRAGAAVRKLEKRLTRETRAAGKLARRTVEDPQLVADETGSEGSEIDAVLAEAEALPVQNETASASHSYEEPEVDQPADTEAAPEAAPAPPSPCDQLRAAVRSRSCTAAIERYAECPEGLGDTDVAATLFGCLVDTGDVAAATTFAEGLTEEVRGARKVRKQDKRLAKLSREQEERRAELERLQAEEAALAMAEPETDPKEETTQLAGTETDEVPGAPEPEEAPEATVAAEIDTPNAPPVMFEPSREELSAARGQLQAIRNASDLERALGTAAQLAASYPGSADAQFLAAEAAYRAAQWDHAVRYFRTGGDPGDGRPLLLFYQAVSLFEVGEVEAAAASLERALPKIRQTPFVDSYTERIRTAAASASDS